MDLAKKKPALVLAIGGGKSEGAEPPDEQECADLGDALVQAIKDEDGMGVYDAISAIVQRCAEED